MAAAEINLDFGAGGTDPATGRHAGRVRRLAAAPLTCTVAVLDVGQGRVRAAPAGDTP